MARSRPVAASVDNFAEMLKPGIHAANIEAMRRQQLRDAWRRVLLARRRAEAFRHTSAPSVELDVARAESAFADLAAKQLGLDIANQEEE